MQVQSNTFVYLRHYFKNRGVSLGGTSFIIFKRIDNKGIIWNIRELLTWIKKETKDNKPWLYDGKIWSHKYLWSKSGGANTKEEAGRAMYTKAENGINYNRMKGVKDSTKQDVKVQLYYAYIKGESNASDDVPGFWNDIRNKSN